MSVPARFKKPAATPEPPKGEPCDFVYAGRRLVGKDGKLAAKVIFLKPDGTPRDVAALYHVQKGARFVLGGIHTGARFDDKTAYGLPAAKWTGQYFDSKTDRLKWEAEEREHVTEYKAQKHLEKAKGHSELYEATKPLRMAWQELRDRGDFEGAEALVTVITHVIRRGYKEGERRSHA